MSRLCKRRALAQLPLRNAFESIFVSTKSFPFRRPLTSSATRRENQISDLPRASAPRSGPQTTTPRPTPSKPSNPFRRERNASGGPPRKGGSLISIVDQLTGGSSAASGTSFNSFGNFHLSLLSETMKTSQLIDKPADVPEFIEEPHHLHVLSTKHNTHITVTKPNRDAIISVSAGNLGFRKAKRGSFDAAYQLSIHVLDKLNQGNWHSQIKKMEVVFRGFGMGRDAVTKILLGSEADKLKPKIVRVTDATKIKFGGTRSPNKRRL